MKTIGITCDTWKTNKFRKRFEKKGYTFLYDAPLNDDVHIFKIQVAESEFEKEKRKIGNILQELEIDLKRGN